MHINYKGKLLNTILVRKHSDTFQLFCYALTVILIIAEILVLK